jgi:hypothetical protein
MTRRIGAQDPLPKAIVAGVPEYGAGGERTATEKTKGQFIELTVSKVKREKIMLWTIFAVCLILWLLGFSLSIGGSLIHLLLVVAVVVLIFNLVSGRRVV